MLAVHDGRVLAERLAKGRDDVKTVPLTLPVWVWGRLVSIAAKRGVVVADLLAMLIRDLIDDDPTIRSPRYVDGDTGVPGHRLDALDSALSAARRDGYRTPHNDRKRVVR